MRLLGAARIDREGVSVSMHSRRSTGILAFLALSRTRQARTSLAAMFWEDAAPDTARANLRSVLSTLQSRLPGVLEVTRDSVAFRPTIDVEVDVTRFLAEAATAEDERVANVERIDACRRALGWCQGELLAGFEQLGATAFTDWIESERRALDRRTSSTAALLVDLLLAEKRAAEAVDAAADLVAIDRYREASYLASMRALVANGEPQLALEEFARCRSLIVDDLGLRLGSEVGELAQALRDDSPSEASTRPVLSRLGGLPVRRALFGRDGMVADVSAAQRQSTGGLITLCGPAGVGKTSLAVEVAHHWREAGRDVVFVDVTNAHDVPQFVETLSNALGGPLQPADGSDGLEGIADVLADRSVSIVLDNVEQVEGAPSVISALLGRSPQLLLLSTSRRPMHIVAEDVYVVPPLEPPTDVQVSVDPQEEDSSLAALKRLACVQLFQHRCVIGGSKPASSADDLRAVGRICQLVDGLPLAIELIAGRRRIMGLADIEASLRAGLRTGDLSMVDGGFRDAPLRHRGLRAALTSTVALLDADARRVFAYLSVFDGPFTFDGIAAICVEDDIALGDVLRGVQALVDFQLLRRDESHGTVWFRMLVSVRALATALLVESEGGERAHARRLAHDCELVERSAEEYFSPANTEWFRFLDQYTPTLRSTLDELHAQRDPRELAVVTALAPYWFDRGRVAEAHQRLSAAAGGVVDPDRPWLAPLCALWSAGMRAEALGYGTAAGTLAEVTESLATLRAAGPPPIVELRALRLAAHVHVIDHNAPLDVATELVGEGIDLAAASGRHWFGADFLFTRGVVHHLSGDDESAAGQFRIAIDQAELHGNRRVWLYARMMLDIVGAEGPAGGTRDHLSELLDLAIEIGDHRQTSWLTMSLGTLSALDGDLGTSAAHFLDALSLSRDADYFIGVGCCLLGGAAIAVMSDDLAEAMRFHASVEPDLESLGRSMPQSYLDVYRELTDHLPAVAAADPDLTAAWSSGAIGPRSMVLTALAGYFAQVRMRYTAAPTTASA